MKLNNTVKKQEEIVSQIDTELEAQEEPKEDLSGLSFDEKIIYWKNKYKKIYKTIIAKEPYIWRRITRREYADIALSNNPESVTNKQLDMYEKHYQFCKVAVLFPENITELMDESAGLCSTLGDEIIFASGFGDLYPKTEEVGNEAK